MFIDYEGFSLGPAPPQAFCEIFYGAYFMGDSNSRLAHRNVIEMNLQIEGHPPSLRKSLHSLYGVL